MGSLNNEFKIKYEESTKDLARINNENKELREQNSLLARENENLHKVIETMRARLKINV